MPEPLGEDARDDLIDLLPKDMLLVGAAAHRRRDGRPDVSDLPDRILAAIEETAKAAHYAIQDTTGVWIARESGYGVGDIVEDECGAMILHARYKGDAQYPHIAHNDPKITLRRCEADKRTVERHRPSGVTVLVAGQERDFCAHCRVMLPCPDLLDRAAAWDVEAP